MDAVVFLDLFVIASSKRWQVCFWVLAIEELSYLNKTFGADRLRYTGLPQLTQNRVLLPVPTSKLCSEVAAPGGLSWQFYLWNYC